MTGRKENTEIVIPTLIFSDRTLSFSESLVEYLRYYQRLPISKIALALSMERQNVWTILERAGKKRSKKRPDTSVRDYIFVPIGIFKDRKSSILEIIVSYLRDKRGLSNKNISLLLNRSDKTVSTVYLRAKAKRGDQK